VSDILFSLRTEKAKKLPWGGYAPTYYVLVQNFRGKSSDIATFHDRKEAQAELKRRRAEHAPKGR